MKKGGMDGYQFNLQGSYLKSFKTTSSPSCWKILTWGAKWKFAICFVYIWSNNQQKNNNRAPSRSFRVFFRMNIDSLRTNWWQGSIPHILGISRMTSFYSNFENSSFYGTSRPWWDFTLMVPPFVSCFLFPEEVSFLVSSFCWKKLKAWRLELP